MRRTRRARPASRLTYAAARRLRSGGRSTGSLTTECGPSAPGAVNVVGSGPRQPPVALQPRGHRLQHREGHRAEVAQRLVGVLAHVQVDLRDRVEAEQRVGVDQQRDVDAVAGDERQPLEQLAPGRDLARQAAARTAARSG